MEKNIVFYCASTPSILMYKIARLLRQNNYSTTLFVMCEKERINYKFFNEAFDTIICSDFRFRKPNLKNAFQILSRIPSLLRFTYLMKKYKPYVVIGVSGNNWQIKLVRKYFFKKEPFIYFPYDIRSLFYKSKEAALRGGMPEFEIMAEKYCFENSDGFIHKGAPYESEPIQGRIFDKVKMPRFDFNFQPYCSEDYIVPLNKDKLSKKDKEIHVVYTGFLADNPESKKIFIQYFKSLLNQKIHLHSYTIVPHISKEEERLYVKNYFKEIEGNPHLHLHEPLGAKELIKEISKYDYALWLAYETTLDNIDQIYGVGNKISTYLEAGLPILYDEKSIYLGKLLDSFGIGVEFNAKNLDSIKKRLKQVNYKILEKKLEKARKEYSLNNNFPRFKKFIEEVANVRKEKCIQPA